VLDYQALTALWPQKIGGQYRSWTD